jgi:hypothetical protein
MERVAVSSSHIVSIGYDEPSETLEVEFNDGVYQYFNVPSYIYESFMSAPSHGIFLAREIKGKYNYSRV